MNEPVNHLVFVYGTLKRGGGAFEHFLARQKFIGEGVTVEKFGMLGGGFPVAMSESKDAQIRGQVYEVTDECLASLDGYEGNGHMFHRIYCLVQCDNGQRLTAQMYFGDADVWNPEHRYRPAGPKNDHGHFEWWPYVQSAA